MADAAVPRPRQEEPLALASVPPPALEAKRRLPTVRSLLVLWAVMVVGLIAWLHFATVRIGAGNWIGRRMSVRQVWSRFLDYLTDLGASPALVALIVAAAAVTLAGAGCGLWLAFALRDAPADDATVGSE